MHKSILRKFLKHTLFFQILVNVICMINMDTKVQMEDTLKKISLEVQAVISTIFLIIYSVVKEDVEAVDSDLFLKIYLVEEADSVVHVEMIFCMNAISPWKMYYMENKSNLISKNLQIVLIAMVLDVTLVAQNQPAKIVVVMAKFEFEEIWVE